MFYNVLTTDQISQLARPTYKIRKDKKATSFSLVDTGSVLGIGQVNSKKFPTTKVAQPTQDRKKATPAIEKKFMSSKTPSSFSEDLKALDTK